MKPSTFFDNNSKPFWVSTIDLSKGLLKLIGLRIMWIVLTSSNFVILKTKSKKRGGGLTVSRHWWISIQYGRVVDESGWKYEKIGQSWSRRCRREI